MTIGSFHKTIKNLNIPLFDFLLSKDINDIEKIELTETNKNKSLDKEIIKKFNEYIYEKKLFTKDENIPVNKNIEYSKNKNVLKLDEILEDGTLRIEDSSFNHLKIITK